VVKLQANIDVCSCSALCSDIFEILVSENTGNPARSGRKPKESAADLNYERIIV